MQIFESTHNSLVVILHVRALFKTMMLSAFLTVCNLCVISNIDMFNFERNSKTLSTTWASTTKSKAEENSSKIKIFGLRQSALARANPDEEMIYESKHIDELLILLIRCYCVRQIRTLFLAPAQ
jgi:hypothetical protein